MPLAEKAKANQVNLIKGIRQISPVSLVQGMPAIDEIAGCNNKGGPTVYQKHRSLQVCKDVYRG